MGNSSSCSFPTFACYSTALQKYLWFKGSNVMVESESLCYRVITHHFWPHTWLDGDYHAHISTWKLQFDWMFLCAKVGPKAKWNFPICEPFTNTIGSRKHALSDDVICRQDVCKMRWGSLGIPKIKKIYILKGQKEKKMSPSRNRSLNCVSPRALSLELNHLHVALHSFESPRVLFTWRLRFVLPRALRLSLTVRPVPSIPFRLMRSRRMLRCWVADSHQVHGAPKRYEWGVSKCGQLANGLRRSQVQRVVFRVFQN